MSPKRSSRARAAAIRHRVAAAFGASAPVGRRTRRSGPAASPASCSLRLRARSSPSSSTPTTALSAPARKPSSSAQNAARDVPTVRTRSRSGGSPRLARPCPSRAAPESGRTRSMSPPVGSGWAAASRARRAATKPSAAGASASSAGAISCRAPRARPPCRWSSTAGTPRGRTPAGSTRALGSGAMRRASASRNSRSTDARSLGSAGIPAVPSPLRRPPAPFIVPRLSPSLGN